MTRHDPVFRDFLLGAAIAMLAACAAVPTPDETRSPPAVASAATASRSATDSTSAILRYDEIHHPVVSREAMVVSQNTTATEVGLQVLLDGGNAVDAAVATAFALAVTLPRAASLGGSGFMLVHTAKSGETVALDFGSVAPAAFRPDRFRNADGNIDREGMTFGPRSAGIPGNVAGLHAAWKSFGTLSWADLVEPALSLAANGIVVTEDLAYALSLARELLAHFPGSATAFLKTDGSAYGPGEILIQSELAGSLTAIRDGGATAFYRGSIARRIVRHLDQTGGMISAADLKNYHVNERLPVSGRYRGYHVLAAPPVSTGGVMLVQMLNVLENFPVADLGAGSADGLHLLAEVMKRAAANRQAGLGDPDFVDVPVLRFTDKTLAGEIAASIDMNVAAPVAENRPVDQLETGSRETTHFSIVDRHGNAVSGTLTLGDSFGSGMAVPGTGILLDNQMRNFNYREAGHANAPAPGKRMVSTMTPVMVFDNDDRLAVVTGTPGGSHIANVLLQLIVNVIDHGMSIAEATHTPRIDQSGSSATLGVEPGVSVDAISLLRERGHRVEKQQAMGSTQSIMLRDGFRSGSADPRRPGALAAGY